MISYLFFNLFRPEKNDNLFPEYKTIMNVIIFSFNALAPMFFPMALGWFIKLRGHIKAEDITFLNRICFRYLLAFHIYNSTAVIDFHAEFNPRLILICILSVFLVMAAAWIVFSLTIRDREKRCIFIVSSFRSNNLIYAIPLAANLFGSDGVKTAAMLVPVTIIFFNFFCVVVMVFHARDEGSGGASGERGMAETVKRTALEILRNPLIAGSVLGIVSSLLGVRLPGFLRSGINGVAAAATPMALILLGAQMDFKQLAGSMKPALGACAVRLLLVPLILVPLMILAGFRGPELGSLMVAFAAPCAVNNLIMARNYNINPRFAAQTVYLSTALSLPTMFIAITVLRGLGFF
jgi:predicted permease